MNTFTNVPMQQPQNLAGSIEPVNTIHLSTLIEFMVNKTYHEILVMADILPSKSDMERKIQIAQFAHRTRQSYVRLLALVKWANSIGKVTKCGEITQFLDQQASLFIDTADKLHTLANQLVVQARLPNFSIPAAIDVLTTGTYPRLPKCIRDKIIPPDPITDDEKNVTLKRLNQIIMYNLVTTDIPPQFSQLIVKKGMVQLTVANEFKVFLTLMSDEANDPWILLKLEILVKDKGVGGGKKLVHDMQIDYLHKLVQSRIIGNESPFNDLYNLLHTFCLSLEIEVLQAQAMRLASERWGGLFQIEDYQPGQKMTITYWKRSKLNTSQVPFQITIVQQLKNDNRVLKVMHTPQLSMQNLNLVEKASKLQSLSIEQLLSDTIAVRSYQKLFEIKVILQKHIKNDNSCIDEAQCSLTIPLLDSDINGEIMTLSIDPHTGMLIPFVSECDVAKLDEVEKSINNSPSNILTWISKLKLSLAIKQCESVLQTFKTCSTCTPLFADVESHPILGKLSEAVLYIKLTKFLGYYVIVEIGHDNPLELEYKYYLIYATPVKNQQSNTNCIHLKIDGCMQLHVDEDFDDMMIGKNRSKAKTNLLNVISICLVRIPYIQLLEELNSEDVIHQGILDEGGSSGLCLKVISYPKIDCNAIVQKHLQKSLLECVFRHSKRDEKSWNVELVFCDRPFKTEKQENGLTRVILPLDMIKVSSDLSAYKKFTQAWQNIARLHGPVMQFAEVLNDPENNLRKYISVYSYTYTTLQLKYALSNGKQMLLTIRWSSENNKFVLQFGKTSPINGSSHIFTSFYLNNMFNIEKDIGKLVQVLLDTVEPIQMIHGLPMIPVLGMIGEYQTSAAQKSLVMNFTVIPQSATNFRITFRELYAIDVFCMPNKIVAIRDGALSQYESTLVKEGLIPILGLQSFLNFFDDKNTHKFIATERDDPPSPVPTAKPEPTEMKVIPKGVWCGNTPKLLSYQTFDKIVKPSNKIKPGAQYSPCYLEMFLGYSLILRTLRHELQKNNDSHYLMPSDRSDSPTSLVFACHTLHYTFGIMFYATGLQLSLSVNQVPLSILQERGIGAPMWQNDELRIIEKFFQTRVASPPFRAISIKSFFSMISAPAYVLQNFIRIMQMELSGMTHEPHLKWRPRLCLTIPPKLSFFNNAGVPSIHHVKDKVVVFCEFVPHSLRLHPQPNLARSIVLPFIWNLQLNTPQGNAKPLTTLPLNNTNPQQTQAIAKLSELLKTLNDRLTPNQDINLVSGIHFIAERY